MDKFLITNVHDTTPKTPKNNVKNNPCLKFFLKKFKNIFIIKLPIFYTYYLYLKKDLSIFERLVLLQIYL